MAGNWREEAEKVREILRKQIKADKKRADDALKTNKKTNKDLDEYRKKNGG